MSAKKASSKRIVGSPKVRKFGDASCDHHFRLQMGRCGIVYLYIVVICLMQTIVHVGVAIHSLGVLQVEEVLWHVIEVMKGILGQNGP